MARHSILLAVPILATIACVGALEGVTTGADDGAGFDGVLLVSAAASLTDAFMELESAFETANPGVDVLLNLASTSRLRQQILEGAPVDVLAAADTSDMDYLVESGEIGGDPELIARNSLLIAVPAGNLAGVTDLEDLSREELLIGLCAEEAPCGALAREVLWNAGVTPSIDSNEPDVRALLTKIEAGELDAGMTYQTDVLSTDGGVEGVDIPLELNVFAGYPIATLVNAPNPGAAAAFIDLVLSEEGQAILDGYGFSSP